MSLSKYITDKKLSYADFGQMIGVSSTAVYRYATGRRTPRPAIMKQIAKVTNGEVGADAFLSMLPDTKRKRP